ncbi:MAG: class I SAM-dependent methyltransferase [Burkholderiales bacterium]
MRVASEQRHFSEDRPSDELPEIYQYWSNTFLRPRLQRSGFDGPLDMFGLKLVEAYELSPFDHRRFLSIGSGDCQTEIALARLLVERGKTDFVFECFELNSALVARGADLARARGVANHIDIRQVDANGWTPSHQYDGVIANSSLHHIQNLEGVFDSIAMSLVPTGTFLTSDTIGRNGHMRWPEALAIVEEYWKQLPEKYRFNCQLKRQEQEFINWDCSSEGFEGIRAQDILPLLIERFDFDFFAGFANIVDPFIDRTFGHNFHSSVDWDRDFVDSLEVRDRAEIQRGHIKPTHIVAAMCVGRPGKNIAMDGLTPRFCVRDPLRAPRSHRTLEAAIEVVAGDTQRTETGTPCSEDTDEVSPNEDTSLQIELVPANPQCGDYLIARIRRVDAAANRTAATQRDDSLEVEITANGMLSAPAIGDALEIGLGSYAAGQVQICARVGPRSVTTSIDVPPPPRESTRRAACRSSTIRIFGGTRRSRAGALASTSTQAGSWWHSGWATTTPAHRRGYRCIQASGSTLLRSKVRFTSTAAGTR